jgi:hypothetical protein
VVRELSTDAMPPRQAVRRMEGTADDALGRGQKGNLDVEEPLVRDLLADERCSRAVLDFLSTSNGGRRVPGPAEEDAQSGPSEKEIRERSEGEEERTAEAEGLGAEISFPRPSSRRLQKRSESEDESLLFFCSFHLVSPWCEDLSHGTGLGGAKESLQRAAIART